MQVQFFESPLPLSLFLSLSPLCTPSGSSTIRVYPTTSSFLSFHFNSSAKSTHCKSTSSRPNLPQLRPPPPHLTNTFLPT
ncbi:hypothetical protein K505DRAFT_329791 [Melanomma pulvis-pyrius CBS 109.77]|uniref:Uncharacterized protein n=1 Tax=Melanomma pulvis-pyrius CBS 109.77 TaxID=1314802 RepID=A0A6A6WT36_9PLEO|nr:hypothetical protein K505DRAFT_329791 [Melanomma pulvis-pyrius CBS 109.77]